MKTTTQILLSTSLFALASARLTAQAQPFNCGSDGSYGAMNITVNTTLDLPTNGIFHCTTITIASGATLRFNRNALNTPVYLLATGDVTINGTINVSGTAGTPTEAGRGGPGGFDGGNPGIGVNPASGGQGPGAGQRTYRTSFGGHSAYAESVHPNFNIHAGSPYGSPLLVPLVGGSGGGGWAPSEGFGGAGGGGGGGAVLVGSNTRIDLPGTVRADGVDGIAGFGSGGAIRLVAPIVAGSGMLSVHSGVSRGRIRVDGYDRSTTFNYNNAPFASISSGAFMSVFPPVLPRLDIIEASGTQIPLGNPNPVTIELPFGSDTNRTVTVRAENFNALVPIKVVLTPEQGDLITYTNTIDNLASNPATNVVNVVVPANLVVKVSAWTQ